MQDKAACGTNFTLCKIVQVRVRVFAPNIIVDYLSAQKFYVRPSKKNELRLNENVKVFYGK